MPAAASDATPVRGCPTTCTRNPRSAAATAQASPINPVPITRTSGAERDESLITRRNYSTTGRHGQRLSQVERGAYTSTAVQGPDAFSCWKTETAADGAAYREQSSFGDHECFVPFS